MSNICFHCGCCYLGCHVENTGLQGGDRKGMVCSSWGSPQWYVMHVTAKNYPDPDEDRPVPDEIRQHYLNWLVIKQYTLPCCCCRSHFAQLLKSLDLSIRSPYFDNSDSFFRLIFDIHNKVNEALKKPVLGEEDYAKLSAFYAAGSGVKPEEYGRAFVVVQPAKQTEEGSNSILINKKLIKEDCNLALASDPDHACVS